MGFKTYIFLFLLFLVACDSSLKAQPTAERVVIENDAETIVDPCAAVLCPQGFTCRDGACMCPSGTKKCGTDCIPTNGCCAHSDCAGGVCENNTCVQKECALGETLEDGECVCSGNKIWCGDQNKCIERDACCYHAQCGAFNRCVPTLYRTFLCFKHSEGRKVCKILADTGRSELFEVNNQFIRASAAAWLSDMRVRFMLNDENLTLAANETGMIEGVSVFHEGVEVLGGFCKEDEED